MYEQNFYHQIFMGEGNDFTKGHGVVKTVSGQPELPDREAMERIGQMTLEKILAALKAQGIELLKLPRIKYLDTEFPSNPEVIAMANTDIETSRKITEIIGTTMLKATYLSMSLSISEEAAQECIDASFQGDMEKSTAEILLGESDADIIFFSPAKKLAEDPDKLAAIMVHEIWHLVEIQHGLHASAAYTHEATATFVQNLYLFNSSSAPDPIEHHLQVVYNYGAHIIELELQGESNPLSALLKPEVRARLERRFKAEVIPLYKAKILESWDMSLLEKPLKQNLLTHPAFEEFRKDPSTENYLLGLKKQGYSKLVDELQQQDTGRLVEYHRKLLEP